MTDRDMRQELEQALNALDNPHWCKTAVASVLDLLSSEAGVQLLEQQLAFAAGPRDVRLAGWAVELESEGAKFRKAFHEQVDRVLEALFPDYRPDRPRADDEVDPRVSAEKLVAGLSLIVKDRKVVAQVLELLDDVGLIKQVARDGSIAAIITLILSARANSKAYHHGQLRWDDALDNVALDTVKAGITGIIVSAIVGAPGLATGGAALASAIPLALVVHAVVSSFVDATYEHVLGGRLIREARGRHATYLEVAAYIRDELYPELERAEALGLLVELAMELRAHPDSRESLVEEALFIIGAMQARPKLLTRGDEKRSSNLAWALREYLSDKRIETQLELPELERLSVNVHKLYWEAKLREPKKKVVPKFVLDGLRLRPKHEPLVSHLVELEQKRPHREAPLAFQIKTKVAKGLVKTVPKQLLASDLVEALRFYCMMRDEAWEVREAPPEISHHGMAITSWRPNTIDDTKEPMQERLGKVLGPYSGWDHPLAQECWNPCYRTGFAQELALGEWRVFEIDVSADHRPHYRYVAIPSARGRKRAQEKDTELLIRSLGQDHPYFRTLGP